jgi:outer membrane protein assembly factor BamE (lipoprotein component of BamABCDE complex)
MRMEILVTVCSLLIAGCTVDNFNNSSSRIKEIGSLSQAQKIVRRGMTMDQVKGALGPPTVRSVVGHETQWGYEFRTTPLNRTNIISGSLTGVVHANRKSVLVTFGRSGRVLRVNYHENTIS